MNIGFDAKRVVSNQTGLGNYGRTLVNDLARLPLQLFLYAPDEGLPQLRESVSGHDNVRFCYPQQSTLQSFIPFASLRKSLWRSRGIVSDLQRDGIQVYHGLSGELPRGIRQSGVKSVVTIHDLIFLRHPEYYNWPDTRIYAAKFRRTLREADRIVAISECTRRDIAHFGHIDPQRISVIYQNCAPRFDQQPTAADLADVRNRYQLPEHYVLSVGTIEQRKNMLLAVKALHHLPAHVSIVMVGRATSYASQISSYAQANGLADRVKMLHGVPDLHLPAIYAQADAFVYPSRYEGFGIPIVEAIRQRLPVAACTGSCLEEAGGPHSLYTDPDDPEAMAHTLSQLLRGAPGREQRIELSMQYIQRFDGHNAAQQFMQLYQELANEGV
ncbi:MAG: glycosyltransferase family 4 protein [Prevotella sp.]|nr:glycosyltransferase family 4 protein [Prevotella sp.]